jgi:hypothetical protein
MRVLLLACAGALFLVPAVTAVIGALFPTGFRAIPLWVWIFWSLFSVWCALETPGRVDSLLPASRRHRTAHYERWGMVLAIANVVYSVVTLICLVWWS